MTNYTNTNIQKMKAYKPPLENRRSYNGLLLDFGERTIPVDERIVLALSNWAKEGGGKNYPEYGDICKKMARYVGTCGDQVMMTNGSDQAMDVLFRTFTSAGDKVIIPSPSFAMFYQCATLMGNEVVMPSYEENLAFPLAEVLDGIDGRTALVVICNPNNPTGTVVELADIERVVERARECDSMVFVDEAYFEFCGITAACLIDKYPNLIITRTFSKAFGLAGLRIGFALSQSTNIEEMKKVRGPYDVNMVAAVAASAALDDVSYVESYVEEVVNEAKPLVESFFRENGVKFWPSGGNFILFRPGDADELNEFLDENGVRVRPSSGININGTLRVTIGTVDQMKRFISVYKKYLTK